MSQVYYITCWNGRTPKGGSLSNADAPALIDRANLDFRDMDASKACPARSARFIKASHSKVFALL